MKGTVVLVEHPVSKRDDRASQMLAERGHALQWRCPGNGHSLPEPGPEHAGAVVYGGIENLSVDESRPYIRQEIDWIGRWLESGKPLLGICLGSQLLARALGARVAPHPQGLHEIGFRRITPTAAADGFLGAPLHVYQWHQEGFEVPPGSTLLATGDPFPNQAFRYGRSVYGLQFHPEVSPAVMRRWLTEASDMLDRPGAHPYERQVADAERFDGPMRDWLAGFLDRWLPPGNDSA